MSLQQVIDFDIRFMIKELGLPLSDAPPPLTLDELKVARERGDQLFWNQLPDGERALNWHQSFAKSCCC